MLSLPVADTNTIRQNTLVLNAVSLCAIRPDLMFFCLGSIYAVIDLSDTREYLAHLYCYSTNRESYIGEHQVVALMGVWNHASFVSFSSALTVITFKIDMNETGFEWNVPTDVVDVPLSSYLENGIFHISTLSICGLVTDAEDSTQTILLKPRSIIIVYWEGQVAAWDRTIPFQQPDYPQPLSIPIHPSYKVTWNGGCFDDWTGRFVIPVCPRNYRLPHDRQRATHLLVIDTLAE
jgi:hypothetical protein